MIRGGRHRSFGNTNGVPWGTDCGSRQTVMKFGTGRQGREQAQVQTLAFASPSPGSARGGRTTLEAGGQRGDSEIMGQFSIAARSHAGGNFSKETFETARSVEVLVPHETHTVEGFGPEHRNRRRFVHGDTGRARCAAITYLGWSVPPRRTTWFAALARTPGFPHSSFAEMAPRFGGASQCRRLDRNGRRNGVRWP